MNSRIITKYYNPDPKITKIQPRTPDDVWVPQDEVKIRKSWKIQLSVFKDYRADSNKIMGKCFEFDYKCSRIPRIVKDEEIEKKLKPVLKKNYQRIKNCYKHYSTLVDQDVYSINLTVFLDFVNETKLID